MHSDRFFSSNASCPKDRWDAIFGKRKPVDFDKLRQEVMDRFPVTLHHLADPIDLDKDRRDNAL